jgi:hypothetical protein
MLVARRTGGRPGGTNYPSNEPVLVGGQRLEPANLQHRSGSPPRPMKLVLQLWV